MASDVLITPSSGLIQFSSSVGSGSGAIKADGDNLVISNELGDVLLGDGASDVFIGDGTNNVDIVFEQNGEIRDDGSEKTITLGSKTTTLILSSSSDITMQEKGGNVGIGTSVPTQELVVAGNVSGSGFLSIEGNVTASGRLTVGGVANFNGSFVNIGGGFGSTGVSIAADGDIQTNGTLTIDGAISASSNITASGNISSSGNLIADDITVTDVTGITTIYNTGLLIGRDSTDQIDFASDNQIRFKVGNANELILNVNSLYPATSNGLALGGTGNQFADLFLAEGGVINFDNGDVTITQTANDLAIAGTTGTSFVGHITASGNISASGFISASSFAGDGAGITNVSSTVSGDTFATDLKIGRDSTDLIDFTTNDNIIFRVADGDHLKLDTNVLYPAANDGLALGAAGLAYSDLFLAQGAVLNFDNGDTTLTDNGASLDIAGDTFTGINIAGNISASGQVGIGTRGSITSSIHIGSAQGDVDAAFRGSMLTLTPTSLINSDGFTGITMETSTNVAGYGISMGARRYRTDGKPAFVLHTHNNELDGTERFRIRQDGAISFVGNITASGVISASGGFVGDLTGTADVATVATTVTITDNESTDEANAIVFTAGGDVDGGNIGLESDGTLNYNPSSGKLTATQLGGTLQTAAQTNITSVGALDGGSISSNFGAINNGASAITTTGTVSAGRVNTTGGVHVGGTADPGTDNLIVDGITTLTGNVTASGNISSSGTIIAEQLTTSDDLSVGDDLSLTSDSSVLNMGAGNDITFTHDGTTGLTIAATPISIDATGELHLNSTTGDIKFQDGGTDQLGLDMDGTGSEIIANLLVNGDDLVFKQFDGTEVLRIGDDATISATKNKFALSGGTDGAHQGDVVFFGGTTSMVVGKIYHYKSDGTWELANPNAAATSDGLLAVALGAASDTNGMLLRGMVTLAHDPGEVGDVLYLDEAADAGGAFGRATSGAPAGNGDIVRVIGYCLHASNGQIWFNPDNTFVEVTA